MTLPTQARVVVIGGGVSGCSVAYHLAQRGWTDILLLERRRLTCGTTWHAAGLIGQLRPSRNMTRLARYSAELYARLEAETGVATGLRQVGSVSLALTDHRREELLRQAALARAYDVEVEEVGGDRLRELCPHVRLDDVTCAVHLPGDGQCDPANVAMALAKGARMGGARIREGVTVTAVTDDGARVTGVDWRMGEETGHVAAEMVVNCGGMWGRDLAAASGVTLPLHACEHFYLVTEPIEGLGHEPVLRIPDEHAYYKADAGKLLLGAFEPRAKPWGMDGIPEDFCFDSLPEDFEHFEPILARATERMPALETAGIHTFFNGPESFTPDDRYHLGEAPHLRGYWVAAGYNSIGIVSSGGAGMALAQWMDEGAPPFDLWESDIRRAQPFQRNRRYLAERVSETLGLLYADHYPFRQVETARGLRRSPLHDRLAARGAVFGELAGWERPNWFAAEGQDAAYAHDWHRQNWWGNQRAEHMAVREGAGFFDLSTFGKIRVEGRDAVARLQRLCANDLDVDRGRIVYTQMLNDRGGIECDLTVTRLTETAFLLIVPAATVQRDLSWIRRGLEDAAAVAVDVTSGEAVLAVMGPRARDVLSRVTPDDLSDAAFPFGTAREIEFGMGLARAHRVSYVGELGWEIYVPTEFAVHAFDALTDAAPDLTPCGLHALDSCRLEKAFRHFGHDVTDEDHVLEAGLGFAVKTGKGGFIGRDAVLRRREAGLTRRMVQLRLTDPEPALFHDEPVLRDGRIVSTLTSGNYGHALGGAVGLVYLPCEGEALADLLASDYAVQVGDRRVAAVATSKPFYDPTGARMRG